jgi:hypothetical protein
VKVSCSRSSATATACRYTTNSKVAFGAATCVAYTVPANGVVVLKLGLR